MGDRLTDTGPGGSGTREAGTDRTPHPPPADAGAAGHGDGGFWPARLAGAPVLELPTDRPRAIRPPAPRGPVTLAAPEVAAAVRALATACDVPAGAVLVAALAEVLARHATERDVLLGLAVPVPAIPGLPTVDGPAVVLPVRVDTSGDPDTGELVARAWNAISEASAHQDTCDTWQDPPDGRGGTCGDGPGRPFPVCLQVTDQPAAAPSPATGVGLDVAVTAELGPDTVALHAVYAGDLFDGDRIERMLGHLGHLLAAMAAEPDRPVSALRMLPDRERELLRVLGTGQARSVPAAMLPRLVTEQAARTPERVAVAADTGTLSYAELVSRAGRIANLLRERGIGRGSLVGVCVDRCLDMLPALLGVLFSGAAYVPVDPWFPPERVRFMLTDSGTALVLTREHLLDRLPATDGVHQVCLDRDAAELERQPAEPPDVVPGGGDPAYVIYTSGSTGVPKGVVVRHVALVNLLTAVVDELGIGGQDVLLAITTPSFDIAALEFYAPLLVGARTVIAPLECVTDGRLLSERLTGCGATFGQGTPLTWRLLVDAGWQPPAGFRAVSGGEALTADLAGRLLGLGVDLWNGYGPTETTIYSTLHHVTAVDGTVPLGHPLANTDLRICEPSGRLTPVGVPGELCIGGVGLAEGYLHRPELTAERFVADPLGTPDDPATVYRTGDVARWRSDGTLEFLGRRDFQVKLRGYRIELGEVESVLRGHPAVRNAAVVLREDNPGAPRLVGYVTCHQPDAEAAVLVGQLRALARGRLPDYMVPSAVVVLDDLPSTPNGKVDRAALRPPGESAFEFADYVAPASRTEMLLARAYGQVLGLSRVGTGDSFFDLGGDSLHAARAVARMQGDFPGLGVRDIYATPVVAALAAALDAGRTAGAAPAAVEPPVLPRPAGLERVPLSFQQEQLWFLDQLVPGEATYNIVQAMRMAGPLDVAALRRALDTVQARHEVLRTTFVTADEVPCQVVLPPSPVPLARDDVSGLPATERAAEAGRLADAEAALPFDLQRGPLLRARLIRLSERDNLLLVCTHHIVFDGWSEATFTAELAEAYSAFTAGREPVLPDLPVQFADFAVWQREWMRGDVLDEQLAYWQHLLAGAPVLELPTDRPRPALPSFRGGVLTRELPADLLAGLRGLAAAYGVSLFMTLLAGFEVLLTRYTGQDDLVVGTATAGRNRPSCDALVGFFVNMVVLRADLSGNPAFTDVLARIREVTLDAYEHQDVPFEKVVDRVAPRRDASRNPLFQVAFGLLPPPGGRTAAFEGLQVAPHVVDPGTARFDLAVNVSETAEGLSLWLEYATDLFDQPRMVRLLDHYEQILRAVVADPSLRVSRMPLLTEAELRTVLVDWQPEPAPYRRELVHRLVVEQAGRTPEAVAATFEGASVSYAELERRSGLVARHLRALGVGHGDVVGVAVPRGLDVPVCLLGVLRAGAAFVPVDLSHPAERVAFVLADSASTVVLSTSELAARLPAGDWATVCVDATDLTAHAADPLPETAALHSACYVLYTSGSTGRPKGVVIEHHALATYLDFLSTVFDFGPGDRMLQFSSLIFDLAEGEIFTALSRGATVVSLSEETMVSPEDLSALLRDERVTYMGAPPALIALLDPDGYPDLRGMLVGGEAFSGDLVNRWNTGDRLFLNAYGPTEATIGCTYHPCEHTTWTGSPPIGRAMPHRRVYLVDRWNNPVPVGVPGEILAAGDGLARGYLNRPGLTAEKFGPDPFGTGRAYRTGDLAHWTEDGRIQFLGRIDTQIKLRGQRIELEEIEAVLSAHPDVATAAVALREDTPGEPRLVGYLVTAAPGDGGPPPPPPEPAQLREHLGRHLPSYMIPAVFVTMAELPLSPTGKADRSALPAPPTTFTAATHTAPRTETEEFVAATFADALHAERAGALDDFFLLGGSSLQAATVLSRVRARYRIGFSMRDFYANPTVESVARRVEDAVLEQAASDDLAALLAEAIGEDGGDLGGDLDGDLEGALAELLDEPGDSDLLAEEAPDHE